MILNRDCFFYKKSDFINRLPDISEESICYIADTQQIYVQGRYFECNVTRDIVEQLIQSKGYLTPSDLPVLTGGAAPTSGEFVSGVSVGGHTVNVQKGKFSEINAGTASKLETPREIALSGDASGSIEFDGSQDVVIETTVHNSTTADRLTTPRTISLDDQATGQVSFDGSGNVTIPVTVNQLDSKNANNNDLNDLVTLNGYVGNLFYGGGGNTSENKPDGVDAFGLLTFKSAAGNYSTQILGSSNRLYTRSDADASLGAWRTIAYLTDNVASATKLQNTRTFTISDGTHSGTSSNFDGTGNVTLRLPTTINADINGDITGDITGDVVGNVTGDLYGNADTASKLETPRTISLSGDASGSVAFDGSENVTLNVAIADNSHTHVLADITDLHDNWGSLLKNAPSIYVTRWPSISEVIGKQNLTIQFNGTTQGGGAYNGTAARTINITPSAIGAATSGHTHTTSLSSNATTNLTVSAGGTTASIADLYATYADQLRTARTISLTGDVTGSVSFDGNSNVSITTTVKDDSHTHSNYVTTDTAQTISGVKTFSRDAASILYVNNTAASSTSKYSAIVFQRGGENIGILAAGYDTNGLYRANPEFTNVYRLLDSENYTAFTYPTTISEINDLHSSWDTVLKTQKPAWLTTVSLSTISDLNSSWDALLKVAPTKYVTRWPTASEIGALTQATADDRYLRLSGGRMTGDITMSGSSIRIAQSPSASSYDGILNADGQKAILAYYGDNTYTGLMTGTHYLRSGATNLIHRRNDTDYTILDTYNYTSTLDSRYVKKVGDTMTGTLDINSSSEALIRYQISGSSKAATGYLASQGAYLYSWPAGKYLHITDAGSLLFGSSTVWHSGNDGSGSGLDADLLDGYQANDLMILGRSVNMLSGSTYSGYIPPLVLAMMRGAEQIENPTFLNGSNLSVYNNALDGSVTHTRVTDTTAGNGSGYVLKIHSSASATPGGGGFTFQTSKAYGQTTCVFRAKVPVGYTIDFTTNSVGGGGLTGQWLTERTGTGKWEWYACTVYFGSSPSASHFYYLTPAANVDWYLAYAQVFYNSEALYVGMQAQKADRLTTSRTINGTSFDGSKNITTANWGTARTITIGNTGKSVNGGQNVSWSLSEIGAATENHKHSWDSITNKPSTFTPSSHTHPISQITNRGTLTFTGAATGRYDGSGNLTINIPSGGMTSVNWNDIDGKPSTFTPSDHNHAWLSGWSDTRSVVETPNSYNSRFEVVGIKNSSTYGISSGTYVQVLGFRGWSDSSGGNAHELAFADNGRIYHRNGATTSWNAWDTVAYTSDLTWNSISGKPSTFTPASHNHAASNITSGILPITHGGTGASTAAGALTNLGITATAQELNYVTGVTTSIQKQLDAKSDIGHTHNINEITNIHVVDTLPSSPISGDLYFVY